MMQQLLQGADVDAVDTATEPGQVPAMKLELKKGANVNAVDADGHGLRFDAHGALCWSAEST